MIGHADTATSCPSSNGVVMHPGCWDGVHSCTPDNSTAQKLTVGEVDGNGRYTRQRLHSDLPTGRCSRGSKESASQWTEHQSVPDKYIVPSSSIS